MSDAPARERIQRSLTESLFVEAGAGTGKTTALVSRIVELVATGRAPLPQIAAITFTRAAAAELGDRVRARLRAAAADSDPARASASARALAEADQAAICTLHAFAQRLLSAFPLEAGLPLAFEVADEVTSQLRFARRWSALLDGLVAGPEEGAGLRAALLDGRALGLRLEHVRDLAAALDRDQDRLEDASALPRAEASPEETQRLVEALAEAAIWRRWCTDAADLLALHCAAAGELSRRLAEAAGERERLRLLSRSSLACARGRRDRWGGHVEQVRAGFADLEARRRALLRARQSQVLAPLLARLRRELLKAARQRAADGLLEFEDLLVLAVRLLRDHPGVRARLATRYRWLLIDEFQDTDPLQVQLATLLAGEAGERLFFVGDARQSIYRFRRADLAAYEEVRERFGEQTVALDRNHRSVPSVLAWVNAAFAPLLDGGEQAASAPLAAHRPEAGGGSAVWLIGGPRDERAASLRERESAAIAAALKGLHGTWLVQGGPGQGLRRCRYRDVAVLMPTRTPLSQLERALEDADIPFRVEAQSLLYATQEVRDLLALLAAIDDPSDEVAAVAALRTPALGCTDRDLVEWRAAGGGWSHASAPAASAQPVGQALARLAEFHARRGWLTPSGLVDAVIRELRLMELACARRRPREAWQRLRLILDQARAFTERGATLGEFCAWVRHLADEDTRVTEQVLPDDDDDAVRVLTVHGAKGLEFPVAILTGLASPRRGASGPVTAWDGAGLHVRVKTGFETAGFADAYERERRAERLEERRLLYVAATRARDHLLVGVHHRPVRGGGTLAQQLWTRCQEIPDLWRPFEVL